MNENHDFYKKAKQIKPDATKAEILALALELDEIWKSGQRYGMAVAAADLALMTETFRRRSEKTVAQKTRADAA